MPDPEPSLYRKLAEVMGEIGFVKKRGRNAFHGYDYVTETDLVDAVREKLAQRNVVVIPSLTGIDERAIKTAKGKDSTITTARIAFTFCDGDSGETHTAEWAGAGDDPADKGIYKAMAGATKYFLMKSFLIPTGDDPEADSETDKRSAGGQARQSDVPSAVSPEPIGTKEATEALLNADTAGVARDDLRKATQHITGGIFESFADDKLTIGVLANLSPEQLIRLGTWVERKRTEAATASGGTS